MKHSPHAMTMNMLPLPPRRQLPQACAVACPACSALAGQRCFWPQGVYRAEAHAARIEQFQRVANQRVRRSGDR